MTSISPNQGAGSGGTSVTLIGTNLVGTTSVKFGTTAATSFIVISGTQIAATAPAGSGTVQVTATTSGGTSNGVSYTYLPVPALTTLAPNQGPIAGGNTVTLTGTNLTNATAVGFGATPAAFTVVSATQITATAPPGGGTVQVTATTSGGTSNHLAYTYLPVPTLATLAPNQGPVAGGNTVTLTGANLTNATAVGFGATPAAFTVVSATQIIATVPPGAAGPVNVTVITPGGASNGVSYTYLPVPTLATLEPNQGPVAGGSTVTLTGTDLTYATAVGFGATPAAFTVVSATQIIATAPPGAAGPVNVTVITPGGASNTRPYSRVQPPGI